MRAWLGAGSRLEVELLFGATSSLLLLRRTEQARDELRRASAAYCTRFGVSRARFRVCFKVVVCGVRFGLARWSRRRFAQEYIAKLSMFERMLAIQPSLVDVIACE